MSERVLQPIGELERVHVAKTVLHVRVDDNLRQTHDLSNQVEGISEPRSLTLLGRQRLDGLEVEVVVEVQVVEVLAVNQKVEHVVALTAHLQPDLDPVKNRRLEELRRFERAEEVPLQFASVLKRGVE